MTDVLQGQAVRKEGVCNSLLLHSTCHGVSAQSRDERITLLGFCYFQRWRKTDYGIMARFSEGAVQIFLTQNLSSFSLSCSPDSDAGMTFPAWGRSWLWRCLGLGVEVAYLWDPNNTSAWHRASGRSCEHAGCWPCVDTSHSGFWRQWKWHREIIGLIDTFFK